MAFDKIKYDNDYQKNYYDRLIINVPKGNKEIIKQHWKNKGYDSLNQYINDLIRKDMNESTNNSNISVGDINQNGNNNSINIG